MAQIGSAPGTARPVAELLAAARTDPAALGALLNHFRAFLLAHAREAGPPGFRPPFGDSALVQETLLAACQHFPDFRGTTGAELAGWLGAILRRVALTQARRESRSGRPSGSPATANRGAAETPLFQLPAREPVAPDEAAAARERSKAVRDAVAGLPDSHRDALVLRFHERLSFDEIGRRLGRSPEAARKLVARAVRELAVRLVRLR
jgi:RNA polymerase sigma-70 factor (ECF subfamily)